MRPDFEQNGYGQRRAVWWAIVWVSFFLLAVLAFLFGLRHFPERQPPATPAASRSETGPAQAAASGAQPKTAAVPSEPIVVGGQAHDDCESNVESDEVMVAAVGENLGSELRLYLQGARGLIRKFYLDSNGVPDADRLRLTELLTVGQRLHIRYVVCRGGEFRYLTLVQAST